jgi:hypothetical protein
VALLSLAIFSFVFVNELLYVGVLCAVLSGGS